MKKNQKRNCVICGERAKRNQIQCKDCQDLSWELSRLHIKYGPCPADLIEKEQRIINHIKRVAVEEKEKEKKPVSYVEIKNRAPETIKTWQELMDGYLYDDKIDLLKKELLLIK